MIREARLTDMPRLLEMGRNFFDKANWARVVEWHEDSAEAALENLIESPDGVLLVIDIDGGTIVGMAGAIIYGFYFNLDHRTGQELFWWTEPQGKGYGLSLWRELEKQARAQGAQSFQMSNVNGMKSDVLGRLYERNGYTPGESTYLKGFA